MTNDEKLTAQEILALPDRELLQPLTVIVIPQITTTVNAQAAAADGTENASAQQALPENSAQASQEGDYSY